MSHSISCACGSLKVEVDQGVAVVPWHFIMGPKGVGLTSLLGESLCGGRISPGEQCPTLGQRIGRELAMGVAIYTGIR